MKATNSSTTLVVSPDTGGVVCFALAKRLDATACHQTSAATAGESEVMNVIGDVHGKDCLIDDIVDSGGTPNAADALLEKGATSHRLYHHGRFSSRQVRLIAGSRLQEPSSSPDSIRANPGRTGRTEHPQTIITIADLLARRSARPPRES